MKITDVRIYDTVRVTRTTSIIYGRTCQVVGIELVGFVTSTAKGKHHKVEVLDPTENITVLCNLGAYNKLAAADLELISHYVEPQKPKTYPLMPGLDKVVQRARAMSGDPQVRSKLDFEEEAFERGQDDEPGSHLDEP